MGGHWEGWKLRQEVPLGAGLADFGGKVRNWGEDETLRGAGEEGGGLGGGVLGGGRGVGEGGEAVYGRLTEGSVKDKSFILIY